MTTWPRRRLLPQCIWQTQKVKLTLNLTIWMKFFTPAEVTFIVGDLIDFEKLLLLHKWWVQSQPFIYLSESLLCNKKTLHQNNNMLCNLLWHNFSQAPLSSVYKSCRYGIIIIHIENVVDLIFHCFVCFSRLHRYKLIIQLNCCLDYWRLSNRLTVVV